MKDKQCLITDLKALRNVHQMHFETSRACNLSCSYCYADAPEPSSNLLMPLQTAIDYIDLVLDRSCSPRIEIVFHGGEPLLQSPDWFSKVIQHAKSKSINKKKEVRFLMQSNGIALTESKLKIIMKYQIKVGISLDGPPYINDIMRKQGESVLHNIELLQAVNCFGGIGCVINNYNFDKMREILASFEQHGVRYVMANPVRIVGSGKHLKPLSASQIFSAFYGIYSYLTDTAGKGLLEAHLAAMLTRYLCPPSAKDFEEILICSHPYCGAGITVTFCDIDGYLFPCGCSHERSFLLSHLSEINDADFFQKISSFHNKPPKYFSDCNSCPGARICAFGCPAFDYLDPVTESAICKATQEFYFFLEDQDISIIERIISNIKGKPHGQ